MYGLNRDAEQAGALNKFTMAVATSPVWGRNDGLAKIGMAGTILRYKTEMPRVWR